MTDEEIIKEFISIQEIEGMVVLSVEIIEWPHGPYNPHSSLVEVKRFQGEVNSERTRKAVRAVLRQKKYFRRCMDCGEINPRGWMHDSRTCQSCAERNKGIVY